MLRKPDTTIAPSLSRKSNAKLGFFGFDAFFCSDWYWAAQRQPVQKQADWSGFLHQERCGSASGQRTTALLIAIP